MKLFLSRLEKNAPRRLDKIAEEVDKEISPRRGERKMAEMKKFMKDTMEETYNWEFNFLS